MIAKSNGNEEKTESHVPEATFGAQVLEAAKHDPGELRYQPTRAACNVQYGYSELRYQPTLLLCDVQY
eukprot:3399221-Rhodomonas_salina.1